ncbi:MAG: hypothetical protein H0W56_09440 [Acidothermales bacterium]|nr:hypothetical protein [Acidothermales bacterium]
MTRRSIRTAIAAATAASLMLVGGSSGAIAAGNRSPAATGDTTVAAAGSNKYKIPVQGKAFNTDGDKVGTAKGKIVKFKAKKGTLYAVTKLTITVPGQGTFDRKRRVPVQDLNAAAGGAASATEAAAAARRACRILTLDLGPLDLNLLGLRIQLNRVMLDITAVPGPGNLLGNLLCAIAGLFDRTGFLNNVAVLLNQTLRIIGKSA